MSANGPRSIVVADRPTHGEPRPYQFPRFEREELSNGLGLIAVHLPGRALVTASLVLAERRRRRARGAGRRDLADGARPDRGHGESRRRSG